MNYYEARLLKTGKWNWTRMNDNVITTAGDCINHPEGHTTKEEAERCFYEYVLKNLKEFEVKFAQFKCEICDNWTSKGLETAISSRSAYFCDEHRNKESWIKSHPFTPDIKIISSY